jgi:hypothetical protein
MTKTSSSFYTYRVDFLSSGHFYYGYRRCRPNISPEEDGYLGSPVTNKKFWERETPVKEIISLHRTREEAQAKERALILENWANDLCLNENAGGYYSEAVMRNNGKRLQAQFQELMEDPEFRKRQREWATRGGRSLKEKRDHNPNLNEAILKTLRENGRKSGKRAYENNLRPHVEKMTTDLTYRDKVCAKISKTVSSLIWITDGFQCKRVHKSSTIPKGWRPGRILNHRRTKEQMRDSRAKNENH